LIGASVTALEPCPLRRVPGTPWCAQGPSSSGCTTTSIPFVSCWVMSRASVGRESIQKARWVSRSRGGPRPPRTSVVSSVFMPMALRRSCSSPSRLAERVVLGADSEHRGDCRRGPNPEPDSSAARRKNACGVGHGAKYDAAARYDGSPSRCGGARSAPLRAKRCYRERSRRRIPRPGLNRARCVAG
jgi:hypothetical protein